MNSRESPWASTTALEELEQFERELRAMAPRLEEDARRLKWDGNLDGFEPEERPRHLREFRRIQRLMVMPDCVCIARFLDERGAHLGRLHVEQLADELLDLRSLNPDLELNARTFVTMARSSESLLYKYHDQLAREYAPDEVWTTESIEAPAAQSAAADDDRVSTRAPARDADPAMPKRRQGEDREEFRRRVVDGIIECLKAGELDPQQKDVGARLPRRLKGESLSSRLGRFDPPLKWLDLLAEARAQYPDEHR